MSEYNAPISTIKMLFKKGVLPFILAELGKDYASFCYKHPRAELFCVVRNFGRQDKELLAANLPPEIVNINFTSFIGLEVGELTDVALEAAIKNSAKIKIRNDELIFINFAIELIHSRAEEVYNELLKNTTNDIHFTEDDFKLLSSRAASSRNNLGFWEV